MAVSRLSQTTLQNAFQKYNNLWDGTSAVGSMDALGSFTVGATSVSSITFSSIPQTYTHLQIRAMLKITRASQNGAATAMRFNGDTSATTSYRSWTYEASNTTIGTGYYTDAAPGIYGIRAIDATGTNNSTYFGPSIVDILEYTNTNKKKLVKSISGYDSASATDKDYRQYAGIWLQTTAISTINIIPCYGTAFEPNSTIALYGIK